MIVNGQYFENNDDYLASIGWRWEGDQLLNQHGEVVGSRQGGIIPPGLSGLVDFGPHAHGCAPSAEAFAQIRDRLRVFGMESAPSRPLIIANFRLPALPLKALPEALEPYNIKVLLPDGQIFACANLGDAEAIRQEWS